MRILKTISLFALLLILPQFLFAQITIFGNDHTPIGNPDVTQPGNKICFGNIDIADGVEVEFDNSYGFLWDIEMNAPFNPGDAFSTEYFGRVNGIPNQSVATLGITYAASGWVVDPPDFSGIGSSTYTLKLSLNGTMVFSQPGMSGSPGSTTPVELIGKCCGGGRNYYWCKAFGDQPFFVSSGPAVLCDRIDIIAENPTNTIGDFTSVTGNSTNIDFCIVDEQLIPGTNGIPTLSQWGLILLALLLLTMGSMAIIRQEQLELSTSGGLSLNTKIPWFDMDLFQKVILKSLPILIGILVLISILEEGIFMRNIFGTAMSGLILSYLIHLILMKKQLKGTN